MEAMFSRSQYLTHQDLHISGRVKQIVYSVRIHSNSQSEKLLHVTADLGRVWQQMECRSDVDRATTGAHTEL
jgi:hypothetical protein